MNVPPLLLAAAVLFSVPLTLLVGGVVMVFYRRALLRWMGRHPAPTATVVPSALDQEWRRALAVPVEEGTWLQPLQTPNLRQELRGRERRFWTFLALLWLLIGLSGSLMYLVVQVGWPSLLRTLGVGLAWASPGWIALTLMARLPWKRGLLVMLVILVVPTLILFLSLTDHSPTNIQQLFWWLVPLQGLPLLALSSLVGIPALRAAAPLLYPPVVSITLLALSGLQVLILLDALGFSRALVQMLHPKGLLALALLLPPFLGFWLVHRVSRALADGYRRRRFSDLSYTFAACGLVVLLYAVLPSWGATGELKALTPLLALLWLPLAFILLAPRVLKPQQGPVPRLLVLRLFRRPGPVGWLFDQIVQRWRFLGPVFLISAADLAFRTLDADDLTDFVEGRLGERFVVTPADLQRQFTSDAGETDHDGRFRVHDICCTDGSWQGVLESLLQQCQLVLMDLRGFQTIHAGCLHELNRLAATPALSKVVVLVDETTDRVTASRALQGASGVDWVEERRSRHATMEALINALCRSEGPAYLESCRRGPGQAQAPSPPRR